MLISIYSVAKTVEDYIQNLGNANIDPNTLYVPDCNLKDSVTTKYRILVILIY